MKLLNLLEIEKSVGRLTVMKTKFLLFAIQVFKIYDIGTLKNSGYK